jgi:hypothetical protein
MSSGDRRHPEAVVVLWYAMRAMENYRRQHGHYAAQWHLLDIELAMPYWYKGDTGLRPEPASGASWRPKGCKSVYIIRHATETAVLIQSVNANGVVEYEIEQGMTDPREVTR